MSSDAGRIAGRLDDVRRRIETAARRSGRRPEDVSLVAVSKGHGAAAVRAVLEAGQRRLGENYAQELLAKQQELVDARADWHFIGRLQRNKVRHVVGRVALVHGIDDMVLVGEIDHRASARQDVLLQVSLAGEAQKGGASPGALDALVTACAHSKHVRCVGLMTMPPRGDDPEKSRPHYRELRALAERLGLGELSMGMSADFEVAVEEGATLVRVGTAIFGPRG